MPRKSKSKQSLTEDATVLTIDTTPARTIEDTVSSDTTSHNVPRQVGPYEDRRKEMQRKLQKMVLSMRAEGYSEMDIKFAINKEKRREERKIIALEEKRANEQKACSNDVIIIPVAWKRNHSDKVQVDVTCDNVRRALYSTGLNPWLDCRREYSPGQKFAYWEHMGVKFRIEIGPDDVLAGVCRIVRSDKPGAYLEHQREKPSLNLQDIIRTLASMGLDKCKDMNTDLMSSDSLIPSDTCEESEQPVDPVDDDIGGNAIIAEKKKQPLGQKRLRRF
jgi:prolyl-tRNA synthetase